MQTQQQITNFNKNAEELKQITKINKGCKVGTRNLGIMINPS